MSLGRRIRNYDVIRKLGTGANAEVYLVEDVNTIERYAMKILLPFDEAEAAFEQEKAVFELLSEEPDCSPYVVCLHDSFVEERGGTLYYILVMERMKEDLVDSPLPSSPSELLHFMDLLLHGLQSIHAKHLAHGDIKLENILYRYARRDLILKYADLGYSCTDRAHQRDDRISLCDSTKGTAYYFSPELARFYLGPETKLSLKQAQQNDVWALGIVFYTLAGLPHPVYPISVRESSRGGRFLSWKELVRILSRNKMVRVLYRSYERENDTLINQLLKGMTGRDPTLRWTARQAWDYLKEHRI